MAESRQGFSQETKILGVIGGMGPMATQLFFRKIVERTKANRDQEHLNVLIWNHATMPDSTEAILAENTKELLTLLIDDAKCLQENGAAAIAIPCNTSHFFADRIQEQLEIPIVNMIRETAKELRKRHGQLRKVGILATDGTIGMQMYQKALSEQGIEPFIPCRENQKLVMKIIYGGVKAGGEINYDDFLSIENELKEAGCQAAIMACTELSCFKDEYRLPSYYVDAMDVLCDRSIEICGKETKGGCI